MDNTEEIQPHKKLQELFEVKLNSSGLTLEDAMVLGIEQLLPQETALLGGFVKECYSLRIKYFDIYGDDVRVNPAEPAFYRLRYLGDLPYINGKAVKYVQPPKTLPHAYFPRNQGYSNKGRSWVDIARNARDDIIITEGELKAAKACKEGFPTIGLGGVWSWRVGSSGLSFLPELEHFRWVGRKVYVVFDSDYRTNLNVLSALVALCDQLTERGAFVYVVSLPADEVTGKVGLDDYLVSAGVDKFQDVLDKAEHIGLSRPLHQLNTKYVYVRNPGFIVDRKNLAKIDPTRFTGHLESTLKHQVKLITKNGEVKYTTASAAKSWLNWRLRSECSHVTYAPGQPQMLENPDPDEPPVFNAWRGWGVKPMAGDATPFLQLIDHLFYNAEEGAKEWFLQWCAYPLQYPGTKLATAVVIYGVNQGTGKSTVGYTLGKIYGDNFTEIQQQHLFSNFNDWCENKQLIMCDDITGSEKRSVGDHLKTLITQEEVRVNSKYIPSYTVPARVNFIFTSNHPDAFYLEQQDRRFFIHEVVSTPKDPSWYADYAKWLGCGGASVIFNYLLNLDTSKFQPQAPAFSTGAKSRMIEQNQSDLTTWLRGIWEHEGALPELLASLGFPPEVRKREIFSSTELLKMYDRLETRKITSKRVSLELQKLNCRVLLNNSVVAVAPYSNASGTLQSRYYCVNRGLTNKWYNASRMEIREHIEANNWIDPPHTSKF